MKRVTMGYSGEDIPLFPSMITAPDISPSRITSSPSLSPQHTPFTNKVGSLENELKNTTISKLVKRVKKLEKQVKIDKASRRTKIVLLEDDVVEEDSSKQGRSLIEELDMDVAISLVPPHAEIQEKISNETEVLLEEEEATKIVQDQGSGEKGEQEVSTANTALNTANVPISTASVTLEKEDVTKVDTAHVIDWNDPSVIRYHALQNRPRSKAEVRKNMMVYLKNQGGYKMKDFKGMSYDDIRPIFEKVWDQIHSFVPMDSEEEVPRLKRAGQDVEAKPAKRQRTEEDSYKDGDGDASFQLKSDSLPHAHAQTTKTYYKHQDSRIKKAQVLKTKTSANSDKQDLPLRYQVYQGRLLESFQEDAKYEHVGHDTRSQVKTTSTPIETNKALIKDEEAEDVDVHLYRSMIGSLMYLTASRPDTMFAVCACARFQVTLKTSHLNAVKRIFRYLKGLPKLGLWYPRDSPFDLEAFFDSDYVGASLDKKSTTEGCQFLGKRLISWQCKKQTIVANSTTEAEYVAAANCCGQVGDEAVHKELGDRMERAVTTASSLEAEQDSESDGFAEIIDFLKASSVHHAVTVNLIIYTFCIQQFWATANAKMVNGVRQLQALIDKKKMIITESSIRSDIHLEDAEGIDCLSTTTIFEELAKMGITPLFDTMMVQASEEVGEDSDHPTDSNQIPIVDQPSTSSQPKQKQKSKRKQMKEAEVAHDETKHEESVLDLEKAKSDQAIEIASLKKRVDKLEKRRKFRTTGLKRLKKVGACRRIESSNDSLGAQEDASKQGRRIEDIDADAKVTLVNETQERQDEELMFDTRVLDGDEMFVDAITGEKDEQSTKLDDSNVGEAVTTAGVEDSALPTTVSKLTVSVTHPSIKDKGKGIMQESERPLTKKDQVALDEDLENTQAMMEADRLLAERLQTREREELTDEEKGKLFMELMEKRRKHFAALRAQEKRNRPPTKAQKRCQMSIYLKHMGGYKYKQLMGKSLEAQESNEKKVEGSKEKAKSNRKKSLGKKRAIKEQQQESPKRQKLRDDKESDEHEEVEADDTAELKKHLVIKKDDDIAIGIIPLATKPSVIVDYKLLKEGIMVHYQLIRADGSSKRHSSMIRLLRGVFCSCALTGNKRPNERAIKKFAVSGLFGLLFFQSKTVLRLYKLIFMMVTGKILFLRRLISNLHPTSIFPPSKMLDANVTYSVIGEGCVIKTDADRELLAAKWLVRWFEVDMSTMVAKVEPGGAREVFVEE
ncbi:hypothetical protein Tco_1053808 [Tanacetum coccineum]|uniref:Reverse transcriptase Ty1/copia-type domain-containing protein n=1 Tax=Tanacetum coccineum TaxID=301880 RepID=A0ABQ5GW74_9ASTR